MDVETIIFGSTFDEYFYYFGIIYTLNYIGCTVGLYGITRIDSVRNNKAIYSVYHLIPR